MERKKRMKSLSGGFEGREGKDEEGEEKGWVKRKGWVGGGRRC